MVLVLHASGPLTPPILPPLLRTTSRSPFRLPRPSFCRFPGFGAALFCALGLPPVAEMRAGEAWFMLVEWPAIQEHMAALHAHLEGE